MNEKLANALIDQGCIPLIKENFSAAFQCQNSIVFRSTQTPWSVLVPIPRLNDLKNKIKNDSLPSKKIEIGKFEQRGSWGNVFKFEYGDEASFTNDDTTLDKINTDIICNENDDVCIEQKSIIEEFGKPIKKRLADIRDIQQVYKKQTQFLNLYDEFEDQTKELAIETNDYIKALLKIQYPKSPIVCKTAKYQAAHVDYPMFKFRTHCILPNIQKRVDSAVNAVLEDGTISQYDVRYISSKMTRDKSLLLSGIQIYKEGAPHPYLQFSIKDERTLLDPKLQDTIKELEKIFGERNEHEIKPISQEDFVASFF